MRILGGALAVMMLMAPLAGEAQGPGSPAAFVHQLYTAYHGKGPDYLGRQAGAVFSPRLLALIRRDRARTPKGDAPSLDGDPICDCQDFSGLKAEVVDVTNIAGGGARVTVRLGLADEARILKLDLTAVNGHWRVDDIHSADTPSLVAFLTRHAGGR